MNPDQIKAEKRIQSEKSNLNKKRSGRPGRPENIYLARCRAFSDLLVTSDVRSAQEGFEYLYINYLKTKPIKPEKTESKTRRTGNYANHGFKIQKGIMKSYNDIEPYLLELEQQGRLKPSSQILQDLLNSHPIKELWTQLQSYAKEKWDIVKIGFTELPSSLVFKNKIVLFRYVLVFMQEMKKERIDKAPGFEAGDETMRVYASLGETVNDVADWLRSKGIRCQSNHPMGGLVCPPPLAGKAGMGWQGKQGILITPEFGPRQRF